MPVITQVEPVTSLQREYRAIFSKLDNGPVILSNHGRAAAVLLSIDDYNQMQEKIAMYERQILSDLALQADEWMSDEELTEAFIRAGVQCA